MKQADHYSEQEKQRRLHAALQGAFRGPATPLDAIPKRNGESRKKAQQKVSGVSAASAKTSVP